MRYSRAGYGQSGRFPGRTIADVVPDITAVLDHIGAPRCLIAGRSGGPHALAALLPKRVAGVGEEWRGAGVGGCCISGCGDGRQWGRADQC